MESCFASIAQRVCLKAIPSFKHFSRRCQDGLDITQRRALGNLNITSYDVATCNIHEIDVRDTIGYTLYTIHCSLQCDILCLINLPNTL